MITPDDKSWTWVLDRPCPECTFDASTIRGRDVPAAVRANARDWHRLLEAGVIVAGRPNEATWSSLEYACHVRDVYRLYELRIGLMLDQDDPLYANWDQDATAVDDRYDEQDHAVVVAELAAAAETLAGRLDVLDDAQWSRVGRRSDGASFTVDTISRYMAHDTIHHICDVTGGLSR